MSEIMILGSGGFGTSLAVLLHKHGYDVTMWSAFQQEIDAIRQYGENKKLLPGIPVDLSINLTSDIAEAETAKLVIFAVPSHALRAVSQTARGHLRSDAVLINVGKGFAASTQTPLSGENSEEIPGKSVV